DASPQVDDMQVEDIEMEDDDSFSVMDIEDDGQGPLESSDASPQVDDMQVEDIEMEDDDSFSLSDISPDHAADELDEIFLEEAFEKLQLVRDYLAAPGVVEGELVAALHTLKGSAAVAGVPVISQIAGPLEQLALQSLGHTPDQAFREKVLTGANLIEQVLGNLSLYRESLAGVDEYLLGFEQIDRATFRFDDIRLLSQVHSIADEFEFLDVPALVQELMHVRTQAEGIGHQELLPLVTVLISLYQKADAAGSLIEGLIDGLQAGHDELLRLFDMIAAGQSATCDPELLARLNELDSVSVAGQEEATESAGVEQATPESEASDGQIELPADDVDEDVLPIFLEETEELIEGIDQSILSWSESPDDRAHLDNLLRHLHTLKGGARMAGIASLGEFTHNFETFLIGLQNHPRPLDDAFFSLLNQQQDEILRRVEIYVRFADGEDVSAELDAMRFSSPIGTSSAATVVPEQIAEQVETVASGPSVSADAVPAPVALPADEVDEDILPIFLEESEELTEGIDQSIQSWSESPDDMTHLDHLLRHLHTLKGGARMAGLNSLGEYAHNFETYLISVQQNPIHPDDGFFSLVNQRQDEITRRLEIYNRLAAGEAGQEELTSMMQVTEPDVASPATVDTDDAAQTQSVDEPEAVEPAAREADKGSATHSAEMVRVSSDLLEELISLAGEASITRGRIEQQISDFGDAIDEMEGTISRIREQVRRLEIEAESRETLLSHRLEEGDGAFDELEMDRYTLLQEISRSLNEGSSDMMDLKDTLTNRSRDAETLLHQQARIAGELQEGLTRTRMVPFARLIPRLRRIVRQVSAEIGKSVRFDAFNVEGELDRSVLDRIVAPLEHMLRNAVDHGIESAEKRRAAGKPPQGRISLRLSREGGYVVLLISDDGGGINVDAVRNKAIERGLMTAESQISDSEIMQFILHAGFSTAQKLTQISGRGVGMDVVVSEIKALGGTVTIDSTLGVGTEFSIRIPFTVSINRALMVVVHDETYAVPLNTIEGIVRVSPYELEAYYQPEAPLFEYAGQPYRLQYIGRMLDKSDSPNLEGQIAPLPVILARSGDHAVALQVDRVIGSREVVVKSLGPQFNEVGGISGATVLGDGSVVIILDVMALVRSYEALQVQQPVADESEPEPVKKVRTVMIVDDSVTVRKVTSRLMERQGWEVITAKDGLDAVTQLQDIYPDVVLLDIEMPRMDGFEVLRRVRSEERLAGLPIIMITSRTGEKHRQQALELGVNEFLGKPFQEASLISTINQVIND
ncbi:MAG: Hpt domain-containing protein, partial [Proteobacteria bacterium]|nr:Hpt domain-containing protein [Pseudomonadota bacterium]